MEYRLILNKKNNNNLREEYIMNLAKIYKEATGTKTIDLESQMFLDELTSWIKERNKIMQQYAICLNYMDIEYDNPMTIEVGKGIYDSIACENNTTTIITPYAQDLKQLYQNKILEGTIKIDNKHSKEKDLTNYIENFDTFMTHNPYHKKEIKDWPILYNDLKYNIILGVYGKNFDKDKESKLKMLKEIKERIISEQCHDKFIKINDDYFYTIEASNHPKHYQKVKSKSL